MSRMILKRGILYFAGHVTSGECKRCIHNHGGEISWEEVTCKNEELKNNIKMDLSEVSC
jgi:hypothetical protein